MTPIDEKWDWSKKEPSPDQDQWARAARMEGDLQSPSHRQSASRRVTVHIPTSEIWRCCFWAVVFIPIGLLAWYVIGSAVLGMLGITIR